MGFIWPVTMLCTVAYIDSWYIDHALGIILFLLLEIRANIKIIYPPIIKYIPIFVKDIDKLPNMGASMLNKFLISNWSKGLNIVIKFVMLSIYKLMCIY